ATDADVDACIARDFKAVETRAMGRLGVVDRSHLVADPLLLRGLPDRATLPSVFFGSWCDIQDRLRFTLQTAACMTSTGEQALFYEMTVDLTTGVIVNEPNVEFFYQDVSNVARVSITHVIEFRALSSFFSWIQSVFSRSHAARQRALKDRSINDTIQLP